MKLMSCAKDSTKQKGKPKHFIFRRVQVRFFFRELIAFNKISFHNFTNRLQ